MNNLKSLRKLNKISQKALSELLGVSSDYVSMLERGYRTPGFKLAQKIADCFCVTVDELNFFGNATNKIFDENKAS